MGFNGTFDIKYKIRMNVKLNLTQSEVSFPKSQSIFPIIQCPKISFKHVRLASLIVNAILMRVTELNTQMSLAFQLTDRKQLRFTTACDTGAAADDPRRQ